MKNWFEKNFVYIITVAIILAISAGIVFLGVFMTKWIVESDLPDWFKIWLITQ